MTPSQKNVCKAHGKYVHIFMAPEKKNVCLSWPYVVILKIVPEETVRLAPSDSCKLESTFAPGGDRIANFHINIQLSV